MEKIYRVPSEYHHRVITGKPKWKLWLRFFLATIPPGLITYFLSHHIPDRWEPWGSVSFIIIWMFFILMLPVFKDLIRWNRHVGMADSGTYWILSDDTLTVVDEETDKSSRVIHRSEVFGIAADVKQLTVVTNKGDIVFIPHVVEGFDELYDILDTWKIIESQADRHNNRTPKQRLGSWIGIGIFVLVPVSGIANLLTVKLLPTIIFSSITLISSSSLIAASLIVNRLTDKGEFWEESGEFILIMLITLAKLALVIYVEL